MFRICCVRDLVEEELALSWPRLINSAPLLPLEELLTHKTPDWYPEMAWNVGLIFFDRPLLLER